MATKRKSTKAGMRSKRRGAAPRPTTPAARRLPAWRAAGIADVSDKELAALSGRIDELADVFAEPDTKAILAEFDAAQPKQRDIDEAIKAAMAVYMDELRETKRALPSPYEFEQFRGQLEAGVRALHSSMTVDEEAVKKNVLATGIDIGLVNDRFFVVRNGEVAVDLGAETRDPRALDWAVIQKIADIFIEAVGLLIGIKGIVAKPDPGRVGQLLTRYLQDPNFWNKTKLFFAFWAQYVDLWLRAQALVTWLKDFFDVVSKANMMREFAVSMVCGYPWYQQVALAAELVATFVSMVLTAGAAIIAKIVLCLIQLAKLTLKVLGLAGVIQWRARMARAAT